MAAPWRHTHVIFRMDERRLTIKEVLDDPEDARLEVERLNKLNGDESTSYAYQVAKYYPQGRNPKEETAMKLTNRYVANACLKCVVDGTTVWITTTFIQPFYDNFRDNNTEVIQKLRALAGLVEVESIEVLWKGALIHTKRPHQTLIVEDVEWIG